MTATEAERPVAPPPLSEPEPDTGNSWASMTAGVVLILLGAAWLLNLTDVIDLRAAFVLPAMLALVGLALVVGSLRGPHPGLIVLGTFLTIATGFAAVAPPEAFRGGLGERLHTVANAAELESRYELGLGDLEIDLSSLELDDQRHVTVALGAGNLNVTLPRDLPVLVSAETGAGEIVMLGEKVDGVAVEQTYRSPGYNGADARLHIEIEVGAGSIEVDQ